MLLPMSEVDSALAAQYWRDGVAGPIGVLSLEEASACTAAYNDWQSISAVDENLRFKAHLFLPWVNRIVRHPLLVAAVSRVLQSKDIWCWSSDFNLKPAASRAYVSPHQDATYAGLHPADQVVTAWVALTDPVTCLEGGLVFFKGSHTAGQLPHSDDTDDADNLLSRGQRCAAPIGPPPSPIPLRAGQATLHHFYTVHSSGPNQSPQQPRLGLAIRYMTAAVRREGLTKECATWIAGRRDNAFFLPEPILPDDHCTADDVARGRHAHADAMRRETSNYFASSGESTRRSYD